ncbi:MAG: mannose/fructose/sorbose PTS transporter subunit IIA [Lactobacillaceae bacterium]|jgi:PTS system mannose-specific IIB component|nr:mannose/fructose/sorbose PTS transporter subunit IIA [Lactobacillaceae bacterium]
MVNIILSSHGDTAKGVLDSSKMIFGEQENLVAVTFTRTDNADKLAKKLKKAVSDFKNDDETLFLVDLLGGTPYNQAALIIAENSEKMAMVSGLNLPMLVETLANRMSVNTASELATMAVTPGQEGISTYPNSLMPEAKEKPASSNKSTGKISVGKKVAGGKGLDLRLVRIDSRLLHGQVATAWTKEAQPKRIIVVSDAVAKDELRKSLIVQAAPSGTKASVIPISKLVEIWDDKRFENIPTLLLFENPEDIQAVVEKGVGITEVNVGSMAYSEGKKMIDKANAVDSRDVEAFEYLQQQGVKFNVRKVPSDKNADLFALIKQAGVKS